MNYLKGSYRHVNRTKLFVMFFLTVILLTLLVGCTQQPKEYGPPERTNWAPEGPRTLPNAPEIVGSPATYWRAHHSDTVNSDEVVVAAAPMFKEDWIAEEKMWIFEGPTLDSMGNLYFSPASAEEVLLVSLSPEGERRWVVQGLSNGCGGVITLEDPDNPGKQIVYAGSYDRAVAVSTDADSNGNIVIDPGEAVWDVPTGLDTLTYESDFRGTHIFGVNYDPTTDAIIGLAGDGYVYALDRKTGVSLLAENFMVPGAKSPANPPKVPEWLRDSIIEVVSPFFREEMASEDPDVLWNILSGTNTKVANYFSVDPATGRIWIAATAPDEADGTVDGVSEFGALYCYKLVPDGSGTYGLNELFRILFEGGSASTPALNADGSRVYVGDSQGKLLCIDASNGDTIWELDVGRLINASVSVASDNGELYCSTRWGTIKVVDRGDYGEEIWRATLDMYPESSTTRNQDLLTASITANGIVVAAGTSITMEDLPPLPVSLGIGLLDRETGHLRYFTENREESVSVSTIAPDGSVYIGFSPTNRMVTRAVLGGMVPEIIGGVQKMSVIRHDLLMRDALYAAADRAGNVANNGSGFSGELKEVEKRQIQVLIDQCRNASEKAIAEGVLPAETWDQIEEGLDCAESSLATLVFGSASTCLNEAGDLLIVEPVEPSDWGPASVMGIEPQPGSEALNYLLLLPVVLGLVLVIMGKSRIRLR